MLVELDVFSGRPNPRWELDEAGAAALQRVIADLRPTSDAPARPPGLGYRGFLIIDAASGPARAYRGFVTSSDAVLADPDLRVERFLQSRLPAGLESVGERVRRDLRIEG